MMYNQYKIRIRGIEYYWLSPYLYDDYIYIIL